MERIGNFEIDFTFNRLHCLSSVRSGRAPLLRHFSVRCVRGSEAGKDDWLRLQLSVGNWASREKSIRGITVGNEEKLQSASAGIIRDFTLPSSFLPGLYDCSLSVHWRGGEKDFSFSITVLDARYMSTDLGRADELAAFVRSDDEAIRAFTAEVRQDENLPRALYNRLLQKGLRYMDVPLPVYPDIQSVNPPDQTLEAGGCCAEMSLLYASLLAAAGLQPVLIEFRNHMAAGCLTDFSGEWSVIRNAEQVLSMLDKGLLLLTDPTCVCGGYIRSWEDAAAGVRRRILSKEPFALVNVSHVLRNDHIQSVYDGFYSGSCPSCRAKLITRDGLRFVCQACGFSMQFGENRSPVAVLPAGQCRYRVSKGEAVLYTADRNAASFSIPSTCNGVPVTEIAGRAFEKSSAENVLLPDKLKKIGSYAFYGCEKLHTVNIPDTLSEIGIGAFSGCESLESIILPGTVRSIPSRAFFRCRSLKTVTLNEGITSINDYAFEGCESLERVDLPASVISVGRNAFAGCGMLQEIRVKSEKTAFR